MRLRKVTRCYSQPIQQQGRKVKFICVYKCGHEDHAEVDHPYEDRVYNNPSLCGKCASKANEKRAQAASREKRGVKK